MNHNVKMLYGCPVPRVKKDNTLVGVSESNSNGGYVSKIYVDNSDNIDIIIDKLNKYFEENPNVRDWVKSSVTLSLYDSFNDFANVIPGDFMTICKNKTEDIFNIIFGVES